MSPNDLSRHPILRAIQFVEGHLQDDISVSDIADVAGYSLYHFCRLFNQATHYTPYDYLMRRRIAEAAGELIQGSRKIIDIAFAYQFNSHEVFSRAFKRVVGLLPSELRKQGEAPPWRLLPRLTHSFLDHIQKAGGLEPVLVNDDALKLYQDDCLFENTYIWHQMNGAAMQLGWDKEEGDNITVRNTYLLHDDMYQAGYFNDHFLPFQR